MFAICFKVDLFALVEESRQRAVDAGWKCQKRLLCYGCWHGFLRFFLSQLWNVWCFFSLIADIHLMMLAAAGKAAIDRRLTTPIGRRPDEADVLNQSLS